MIPVLDLSPEIAEIRNEINEAIQRVIDQTAFIMGPDVQAFENEAASYLGTKHAIGVNSGTDALVIGLKALGVGAGDEVITTPFSFFATAESISIIGAKPVFVDIDEHTFNINPELIEQAITDKTKAIMPVHLYGRPAAMGQILEIAEKYNLFIVEDCAQSFGARYYPNCCNNHKGCSEITRNKLSGKQTGTIGHVGAFSFFPSKNLGGFGDGGLIVTDNDEVAEVARMLRVHGAKKKYHNEVLGFNSRLDTIQAAILRIKLKHIDRWNNGRLFAAKKYNELLSDTKNVITPSAHDGNVFHQYTIRIRNSNRDNIQVKLNQNGIGTMVYYPIPQDQLPIYKGLYSKLQISDQLAKEVLSLPIWPSIPIDTQEKIIQTLRKINL